MGIDRAALRFLLSARDRGVSFERTLTFGHQDLNVRPADLADELREAGLASTPVADSQQLLTRLGAQQVDVLDVSDYEGPVIQHDLNEPVPDALKARFTAVFDGGTLEHVFNAACGLKNAMELVAEGGHLITFHPANNFLGHGFYQFSPELFFRALSPENGYAVERVVLAEVGGAWYEVVDPASVRGRVEVAGDRQVYILVQARRAEAVPVFRSWPQQSDYTARWVEGAGDRAAGRGAVEHALRQRLRKVGPLWALLRKLRWAAHEVGAERRRSFDNREHFRPVER